MKQSLGKPVSSRKKQAPDQIDERTSSLIHSPNLKYQLFTNEAGSLVRQLRKDEFNQIMNLLNSNSKKVDSETTVKNLNKILICVGAPGTGKTSVIKQAITEYQNECKSRNKKQCSVYSVNSIRVIFFNGNALRKIEQLKKYIQMQNTDGFSVKVLSKIINIEKSSENCVLNVIYIEQFQKIVQFNNEDQLKQLMLFFGNRKSKENEDQKKKALQQYVLIGTSNNPNIEQMMLKKIDVSYRLKIVVFKPYSTQQKIKIVNQRIGLIKQRIGIELKIPQKLIKFIIMKLNQNKRDDTRTLIEVIKQILLISQSNQSVIDSIDRGQSAVFDVSLEILQQHEKIRGMLMNSKVDLIERLNFKQHLVLTLLYREFKTNQSVQMRYTQLEYEFNRAHRQMGLPSSLDAKTMVEELDCYGMVQIRNKSSTKTKIKNEKVSCKASIILKVSLSDIERALSKVALFRKYFS